MIIKPKNINSKNQFGYIYLFGGYYITTDPIGWFVGLLLKFSNHMLEKSVNSLSKKDFYWRDDNGTVVSRAEFSPLLYSGWWRPINEFLFGLWLSWRNFYRLKLKIPYLLDKIERKRFE